jgi:hypothetical protein
MRGVHIRLAAVLAASAAFIGACDRRDCHDQRGQPIGCGDSTSSGHGFYGGGNRDRGDAGAVARGGFGGTGDGGGGGEGGGE